MATHKFGVGQRVRMLRGAPNATRSDPGRFTIIRQMPADTQGPMYRIKGDGETHERVALETQLETVF